MTAFGSMDDLVSADALQEARVQTSSSVPEFGRLPGGQVSLSSRSGTNQFHGSLMYGFRNDVLDSNNWFANQQGNSKAAMRLNNFGAALGGPIWRDHTFFFLSYEGLRLAQPFVWLEPVPSLAFRASAPAWAQPVLNLFPQSNGNSLTAGLAQWSGQVTEPSRLDVGAVRVDHAINSRLTVFARFSDSPSFTAFPNNSVNTLNLGDRSLTLALNARASANWAFDSRLNVSSAVANSVWNQMNPTGSSCSLGSVVGYLFPEVKTCDYLLRLSILGVGSVVSGLEGQRNQSQFQFSETGGWHRASHSLHFGVDYRSRRRNARTPRHPSTSSPAVWPTSIIPPTFGQPLPLLNL